MMTKLFRYIPYADIDYNKSTLLCYFYFDKSNKKII